MHITLNYAYNLEQLKRTYRFNIFPTPRAKFFMLFFSVFIFSLGSLLLFLAEPTSKSNALLFIAIKNIMLAVCLVWAFVLLIVALYYFYLPVYAFKKSPFYEGNFTVNLIHEGLAYKQELVEKNSTSERNGFVHWAGFTKKAENEEFIFLFMGRKQSILPKAAFLSPSDLQEFRLFLMEKQNIKTKKFNRTAIWINN